MSRRSRCARRAPSSSRPSRCPHSSRGGGDDDRVDRPGGFHGGAQRQFGISEAMSHLDTVAGDGSRLERGERDAASCGRSDDDRARPDLCGFDPGRSRLVEDRPEPGIAATGTRLAASALANARGMTASNTPARDTAPSFRTTSSRRGSSTTRDLRSAGEQHPAAAPPEPVTDEVRAERPEVLGARASR